MKELLDRLKQIDLTTYERYAYEVIGECVGGIDPDFSEDEYSSDITIDELHDPAKMAWLQACLQDAISGKGWSFQLVLFQTPARYSVSIIKGEMWIEPSYNANSPTKSLLAAYIAACEAMT